MEVCAGSGLWAKLLSCAGADVIATDATGGNGSSHFPVRKLEASAAVQRYTRRRALLLCWPPFRDRCAWRALRAFGGDRVIYVGDSRFTAEREFHDELKVTWEMCGEFALPSWPGTRDAVRAYQRS